MSNQVPEGSQLSPEVQFRQLRNDLAGNTAFGRMRGRMNARLIEHAERIACDSGSARRAMEEWDADNAAMRVMMNLLRKYDAEGLKVAIDELHRALSNPQYRISGETVPVEQTSPFTIIVINPEETFAFLRWMMGIEEEPIGSLDFAPHKLLWDRYTRELKDGIEPVMRRIVERTERPVWENPSHSWFPMQCWHALLAAFAKRLDIRGTCKGHQADNLIPFGDRYIEHMREIYHGHVCGHVPSGAWTQARITSALHAVPMMACAFGVPMQQSDVLALYPREVQKTLLATWQFNLPTFHNFGGAKKRYTVGFHPEAEHVRWQKERPAFASLGVAYGMGAIVLPNAEPGADTWYSAEEPHILLSKVLSRELSYRY